MGRDGLVALKHRIRTKTTPIPITSLVMALGPPDLRRRISVSTEDEMLVSSSISTRSENR